MKASGLQSSKLVGRLVITKDKPLPQKIFDEKDV